VRAAFFDLDKTVIAKSSIPAFGRPFRRGGLVKRRVVLRALIGQLIYLHLGADENRLARIRESMLTLTKGWHRDRVRDIVRETLLETVEPLIYDEALGLMEAHHRAGDRVYLVSASPEEIVVPLAELLGADGAIASVGEVDDQGRYTGRMAFYASGDGKAEAIRALAARAGIELGDSTAYSDSATDLPMLESVGHPIVVNPDRSLAKVARERNWEIRQFTKPVRLRNRVSVRAPVLTTGLALAAGAVALWWRAKRPRATRTAAIGR
jgi:HAD superfamily hydrolase (TIGR01490 family)